MKFKVAAALGTGALCAAVASCSPGSPATATATAGTQAPPVTVLTKGADNGNGDIFLAPQSSGQYASGPEIVSITGTVLWFHPLPAGTFATDFRTQTYLGKPVLTWFQGGGNGGGEDVIYNDRYQQIATVKAGNGYLPDFHEFLITPWNTALILADTIGTANLTSHRRPRHQQVIDGIVQEIDISTGKVLFQWDSADHVPYSDSYGPRPPRRPSLGLVPHQRRPPRHRRQPADQLPLHLDDLQGEPAHREDHLGARRQAQHVHDQGRPRPGPRQRGRDLRLPARPGSPRRHDEYTFFDDESDGHRRCCPTAGWSR